jgi:tetratricopeptide (TPR) repeat protein
VLGEDTAYPPQLLAELNKFIDASRSGGPIVTLRSQLREGNAGRGNGLQRALAIDEKAPGPDSPALATDLNNLGFLLRHKGDYIGAKPLYRRALAIDQGALGQDHPVVALNLNNLAVLLQDKDFPLVPIGRFNHSPFPRKVRAEEGYPCEARNFPSG